MLQSPDGDSFRGPYNGSLLHRLWPAIEVDYERAFDSWRESFAGGSSVSEKINLVDPVLRRFAKKWESLAPEDMPGNGDDLYKESPADERKVEFYWVGSAARHAGTIVHRWLQRISDGHTKVDEHNLGAIQTITRRWALDLGVSEEQVEDVCQRTEVALTGILADEKGRWILHGDGECELPVTGVVDERVESIVIDRVRVDEHGTHWIIDYKTSTHEGGDLGGFLQQESERYRPQLQRYAALYSSLTGKSVRTALYFPLLQEFCEVDFQQPL